LAVLLLQGVQAAVLLLYRLAQGPQLAHEGF
jgi:hypothetical protein